MQYNSARYNVKSEDRCVFNPKAGLCAVVDGHGGAAAARLCCETLAGLDAPRHSEESLSRLFSDLDLACASLPCKSGAALTVCSFGPSSEKGDDVLCANVGDAFAVVVTPSSHFFLTESHRLQDSSSERARLGPAVGFAEKDGLPFGPPRLFPGGLACSRSIGDADSPLSLCAPSIHRATVGERDVLVVASDGLWDSVSVRRICDVARSTRCAQSVLNSVKCRFNDDASAIVASKMAQKSPPSSPFSFFRVGSSSSMSSSEDEEMPARKVVRVAL